MLPADAVGPPAAIEAATIANIETDFMVSSLPATSLCRMCYYTNNKTGGDDDIEKLVWGVAAVMPAVACFRADCIGQDRGSERSIDRLCRQPGHRISDCGAVRGRRLRRQARRAGTGSIGRPPKPNL